MTTLYAQVSLRAFLYYYNNIWPLGVVGDNILLVASDEDQWHLQVSTHELQPSHVQTGGDLSFA